MATFLMLHGIPGSAATWDLVAKALQDHHEVLVPDLLGFGSARAGSDEPDALLAPSQARRLVAVLDQAGVEEVVVVGHDFGGPVAAHLLATAPERVAALALFATNAFPDTPIPFPLSVLKVPAIGEVAERLLFSRRSLALMVRRGVGRPRVRLDLDRYVTDQPAIATIFAASLRRLEELYLPVEAALGSADLPALVGWGERDPFFPVEIGRRTAALLPAARFRIYEDAGHFLPEERPREMTRDLLELAAQAQTR